MSAANDEDAPLLPKYGFRRHRPRVQQTIIPQPAARATVTAAVASSRAACETNGSAGTSAPPSVHLALSITIPPRVDGTEIFG